MCRVLAISSELEVIYDMRSKHSTAGVQHPRLLLGFHRYWSDITDSTHAVNKPTDYRQSVATHPGLRTKNLEIPSAATA